jgi:hypothetical protein
VPSLVYSHRFVYSEVADGLHEYRVPEGMRAVITSILAANTSVTGAAAVVRAHGILISQLVFPVNVYTLSVECRAVVYGGELIQCLVDRVGVSVYVSGFLFTDLAHESGPPASASVLPAPIPPPRRPTPVT